MPHPVFAAGKTALISGAASGVGYAVATLCRSHGMALALIDNNASNLARAKESLSSSKSAKEKEAKLETYEVDVSQISQWRSLRTQVEKDFGSVDFLMLNAGIGLKWDASQWENEDYWTTTLATNLGGVYNGLAAFYGMVKGGNGEGEKAIVLTGSKQGITNPPGNPAYNASKSAVKTIAEQLSYDLRETKTSVHLLIPGWTWTGITTSGTNPLQLDAKDKPAGAWTAEQVAKFLEERMGQNKFYIVCPDNDVTEDTDKRRMLWSVGDVVYGRQPLSRWREEYKEESTEWMKNVKLEQ